MKPRLSVERDRFLKKLCAALRPSISFNLRRPGRPKLVIRGVAKAPVPAQAVLLRYLSSDEQPLHVHAQTP